MWSKIFLAIILVIRQLLFSRSLSIGVNYGFNGDKLPSATDVVSLYSKCQIKYMRIFEPKADVLEALRGKNIVLVIGARNEEIENFAKVPNAALAWLQSNVIPYINDVNIGYIVIGNEAIPGPHATFIAQAISTMTAAIQASGITKDIKVSTVVSMAVLASSYPPSSGAFSANVVQDMANIAVVLGSHGASLMVNVYPYFAYSLNPSQISLDYALFRGTQPVIDGDNSYFNLFDAMVDSVYAALEKVNASNIGIIISETGWPKAGNDPYSSVENAQAYNKNCLLHVSSGHGTPRRPGQALDVYFFEMFNEDLKPAGVEQNWGFFTPNMQPNYPFWSC